MRSHRPPASQTSGTPAVSSTLLGHQVVAVQPHAMTSQKLTKPSFICASGPTLDSHRSSSSPISGEVNLPIAHICTSHKQRSATGWCPL
ncbi:hypothetical protein BD309DRAFT_498580 [Dichomitus squalens]|nr:hypothetical protein BD309DRAFT_498580 [Dichomitus squalens]